MIQRKFVRTVATTLSVATVLIFGSSQGGEAQPAAGTARIGVLDTAGAATSAEHLEAFRQGLRVHGHVEGQSFALEYRSAEDRTERLSALAAELVALRVDVIVTRGEPAALAATRATRTIPIVMATSGDPPVTGGDLARPAGNVTGFHVMVPQNLGGKRLQLLKEAVPPATRIGMLWSSGDIYPVPLVKDTERVAREMGLQLKNLELRRASGFEPTFEDALFGQIDAVIVVEDTLITTYRSQVLEFVGLSRLPAIYGAREFVDAGGLMSYGADRRDLFCRAATYVHRILNGARPADLPMAPPTKFELAINLKTAERLGLTIPPSLLRRADSLIR